MEVKYTLNLYIVAQNADAGPPLGTILGNLGVNSTNFCKEFNTLTQDLPNYLTVSVTVSIFTNKSFKIALNNLPLGKIIGLLKTEKTIMVKQQEQIQGYITLQNIIQLALFKFPTMKLPQSLPIILGTIKSSNLIIV